MTATSTLYGREHELLLVDTIFETARERGMQVVFIEGEAGIGKSLLIRASLDTAKKKGFMSFAGACEELELQRPFAPFLDAFRDDSRVTEVLGSSNTPARGPLVAIDGLIDRVEELALERAIVIAIDDVQWADASTIQILRSLGRRLTYLPVALLVAFRPIPRPKELERLLDRSIAEGGRHVLLEPLSDAAVDAMVTAMVGGKAQDSLLVQVRAAAGNPFFVHELVTALENEGSLHNQESAAQIADISMPPNLRLTILRRLSFLSPDAQQVLKCAAILGGSFTPEELEAAMNLLRGASITWLQECLRAQVLVEEGQALRFRHDLIREALYLENPAAIRKTLHREAAVSLRRVGTPMEKVAQHFALGASPGDTEAIAILREVAGASFRSPETAVLLLRHALDLASVGSSTRDEVVVDLAEAMGWAGETQEAIDLARAVVNRSNDPHLVSQARTALVRSLWVDGRWVEALAEVDLQLAGDGLPAEQKGLLLALGSCARAFTSPAEMDRAEREARQALDIGEQESDDLVTLLALLSLSVILGDVEEQILVGKRAVEIARGRDELSRFHPHLYLGMALRQEVNRYEDAETVFREGMRIGEEMGTVWDIPAYHAVLQGLYESMGRWDEAVAEGEACITAADEVGTRLGLVSVLRGLGWISLRRGDATSARDYLERAEKIVAESGPQWGNLPRLRAGLMEAAGDKGGALNEYLPFWSQYEFESLNRWYQAPEVIRLALGAGQRTVAKDVLDGIEAYGHSRMGPDIEPLVAFCRGLVDDDPDLLLQAATAFESDRGGHLVYALEATVAALLRADRHEEARLHFGRVVSICEEMGARGDLERIASNMAALGLSAPPPVRSSNRPVVGWEALTQAETRVALLAAEGLTNPEIGETLFVSRRTVQTHLSHIFDKLQVRSRVELAALVARESRGRPVGR